MASKTALPIARLRALGCKVSTLLGHDVPSPLSGRSPGVRAIWKYGITLPAGLELPSDALLVNGRANAEVARDGRIIVTGLDVKQPNYRDSAAHLRRDSLSALSDRTLVESQVAALLSRIADTLNGR